MTEKIQPKDFREMSVKEIQRTINEQRKNLKQRFTEEPGSKSAMQPSESYGTMKRNIARGKTILNEKLDGKTR